MLTRIRQLDTHRLIPSKFSERRERVHNRIATGINSIYNLYALRNATDPRVFIVAQGRRIRGIHIGPDELVNKVPFFWIVNGSFVHTGPNGSRFNDANRGAWYTGLDLMTSIKEISWHKVREFKESGWRNSVSLCYDDYITDISGEYDDIRRTEPPNHNRDACLAANSDYQASQAYANELLNYDSPGLIYPSVRHRNGYCIACFRPALVCNVRKHAKYRLTWTPGNPEPNLEYIQLYSESGG